MLSKIDTFTYNRIERKYWRSLIGNSNKGLAYLTGYSMTQNAFYFISIDSFIKMSPFDCFLLPVFYLYTPNFNIFFIESKPKLKTELTVYELDYKYYFLEKHLLVPMFKERIPKVYCCLFFDNLEKNNVNLDIVCSKWYRFHTNDFQSINIYANNGYIVDSI